jgi:hypothetical protein
MTNVHVSSKVKVLAATVASEIAAMKTSAADGAVGRGGVSPEAAVKAWNSPIASTHTKIAHVHGVRARSTEAEKERVGGHKG